MDFFTYAFQPQYAFSIWVYNAIFILTTAFAFLSNSKSKIIVSQKRSLSSQKVFFYLSFLCAWIFFAFSSTGTDYQAYVSMYENASFSDSFFLSRTTEKGYLIMNVILKYFIPNAYFGIAFIKTITLLLVWGGIRSLRSQIHIGFAVMAYMALFYFQSFNLLRISLSGSICFIAFVYLIKNKKKSAILLTICAISIHRSALLFLITLMAYFLYRFSARFKSVYRILFLFAVLILTYLGNDIIIRTIESGVLGDRLSNRYSIYLGSNSTFGYAQIVFYLPVFFMIFDLLKTKSLRNSVFGELFYIWVFTSFTVALLGYDFGILTRAAIYFSPVFVIFIPYYMRYRQDGSIPSYNRKRLSYSILSVVIFCYWILRYMLTISSLFIPSGLYEYKMF